MNNLVAIIGDAHFGFSDNTFLESQLNFFRNQLIPYLKQNQITKAIFTGDFFDSRRSLDIYVQNNIFELLEKDLKDFEIYIYLGNHCIYYKNSSEINSLRFLKHFPNIHIIEEISKIKIFNKTFLIVPWLVEIDSLKNYIAENIVDDVDVVMGHFDLIGAAMSKSVFSKTGLQKELLHQFPLVFSGHYHCLSKIENNGKEIVYVGSPYQMNFGDSGDQRGFHILNCDDFSYKFIENIVSIKFVSLNYPEEITEEKIKGNKINVYLKDGNENSDEITEYLEKINKYKPVGNPVLKTIENFGEDGNGSEINNSELQVKSLRELFDLYISGLGLDDSMRTDVENMVSELYQECQKE